MTTENTDGNPYTLTLMLELNDRAKERRQVQIISEHRKMFRGPGAAQAKINALGKQDSTSREKKRGGRTALLDPPASWNVSTQPGQMQVIRARTEPSEK